MSNWQPSCDDQPGAYALFSDAAPMRRQSSLQPIAETSTLNNEGMVEYTPEEFITNFIVPTSSPPAPSTQTPHPQQLHVQLTPNTQWSTQSDGSISPTSTPSTALMTPVTQSGNTMSRQGSCNPNFLDEVSMLRVHSDSSLFPPLLSEDGTISFSSSSFDVESKGYSNDNPHFLDRFTGPPSESFLSPAPVSAASIQALAASSSYLAEGMTRSASDSSEGNASNASASSVASRPAMRQREINAQAGRCKIAPAPRAINSSETKSTSNDHQTLQIQSEDGSHKNVGVISRAPYVRPSHPKIRCPHCNDRAEGFRGAHELDRHIARAHSAFRKGFICVDASPDKKFLANCKHCRNQKVYGAYYNAAAHLRRAHFHPRERGRKGKGDKKRGGIGGGDDPPMDHLKQHWIREVEVENKQTVSSPESASDSAEQDVNSSFDAPYNVDMAYNDVPQHTNESLSMDPNQFVDYSLCASEPLYNPTIVYTHIEPPSTTDISHFEFDAYQNH